MASAQIQFRSEALEPRFAERTSATPLMYRAQTEKLPKEERYEEERERSNLFTAIAERDLERYYYLLQDALAHIHLSEREALFLVDVFNGTIHMPYSVSHLWVGAHDAAAEGYAEKWDIDGSALVEKLRNLTPFECMAIADAIERAWEGPTYYITNMSNKVWSVGLARPSSLSDILKTHNSAIAKWGDITVMVVAQQESKERYLMSVKHPSFTEPKAEYHNTIEQIDEALGGKETKEYPTMQNVWCPVFAQGDEE